LEYNNLPKLGEWAALCAVVETGGVRAAADRLHIGQPAVTKRLRALDAIYGVPLMERVGGRLRLTAAGERVYLLAVQTLERQSALYQELQDQVRGLTSMRLEVTSSIGEHLLPELLLHFSEEHPQYRVNSRMTYSRIIQSHLDSGITDLALMESAPDHPDILVQPWGDDELWLVCGKSHSLAGTELVPVEQLTRLSYVLREKNSSSREEFEKALHNIGIDEVNLTMEVGSTDTIVNILRRGQHVSFLPRFAVLKDVNKGSLFHVKVKGFRIMRTLWIARNKKHMDHPVAEAFIKMLREWPMGQLL
jgi:DNA-binding transcriptional LysR family regulator